MKLISYDKHKQQAIVRIPKTELVRLKLQNRFDDRLKRHVVDWLRRGFKFDAPLTAFYMKHYTATVVTHVVEKKYMILTVEFS